MQTSRIRPIAFDINKDVGVSGVVQPCLPSYTTEATVVCDVIPELERVSRHADAGSSSTGTAAAMKGSDGVDMTSTFQL